MSTQVFYWYETFLRTIMSADLIILITLLGIQAIQHRNRWHAHHKYQFLIILSLVGLFDLAWFIWPVARIGFWFLAGGLSLTTLSLTGCFQVPLLRERHRGWLFIGLDMAANLIGLGLLVGNPVTYPMGFITLVTMEFSLFSWMYALTGQHADKSVE